MKVILNADIPNLGEEGDVLNVSPGYARNYLLPKGLVSMYNKTNLSILDGKMKAIEKRKAEKRQNALGLKERLNGGSVNFVMPAGDNGKLFGAVTAQMIVDQLAEQDMVVERKRIDIPGHTLKALGNYKIRIRLYGEEEADLLVNITREGSAPEAKVETKTEAAPAPAAEEAVESVEAEAQESEETSDEAEV